MKYYEHVDLIFQFQELKEVKCASKESLPGQAAEQTVISTSETSQECSSIGYDENNPRVPSYEAAIEDNRFLLNDDQKLKMDAQEFADDVKEDLKANL